MAEQVVGEVTVPGIPSATVARLPFYLRALRDLVARGVTTTSSVDLAELSGVGPAQLRKDLSFDLLRDLTPVGQISSAATFLVVHSSVPASSVQDFIALARKHGAKMNAGSGGHGSANHLTLEMFKQHTGIQATHIAYKGSGPATIALMGGEVDFSFAGAAFAATSFPRRLARRRFAIAFQTSAQGFHEIDDLEPFRCEMTVAEAGRCA